MGGGPWNILGAVAEGRVVDMCVFVMALSKWLACNAVGLEVALCCSLTCDVDDREW